MAVPIRATFCLWQPAHAEIIEQNRGSRSADPHSAPGQPCIRRIDDKLIIQVTAQAFASDFECQLIPLLGDQRVGIFYAQSGVTGL